MEEQKTDSLTLLRRLNACQEARAWAAAQPDTSPAALWAACPRGDWLTWYLGRLARDTGHGSPEHRRAVRITVLCARTAPRMPAASAACLDQIDRWLAGEEVDLRQVRTAAAYAYAAAAYAYAASGETMRVQHMAALADLADLIRAAIPECPMPKEMP